MRACCSRRPIESVPRHVSTVPGYVYNSVVIEKRAVKNPLNSWADAVLPSTCVSR